MREYLEMLYEKRDKTDIYLKSDTELISKLIQKLIQKFGSVKSFAEYFKVDESTVRRWKRSGIIPLSLLKKLIKNSEFRDEVNDIKQNTKWLSVPSSPNKVKIPEMNPEIAYIVGYISGDGHIRNPTKSGDKWEIIVESWSDSNILKMINKIVSKNFGIRGNLHKNTTRKGWRLFISSKIFHRILTRLFKIPVGEKYSRVRVPQIIKNANEKIRQAYIQGWFDAEGFVTYSHNKPQIEFFIKNRSVTKWIKQQLENFGIKVYQNKRGTLIIRYRQIDNFCSFIGFRHSKQLKKLADSMASGNTRAPSGGHD
jgi:DNA-binding transcriptional regulator YiaG